ncbi:22983_t:CDS:2, partial [Gigaspora rosea]
KDRENGINTIEAKLEYLCPYYSRLDAIYGERQNIEPTCLENFGLNYQEYIEELENDNNSDNIQDQRNNRSNYNNDDNTDNESELEN